jgi:hypothetical protein
MFKPLPSNDRGGWGVEAQWPDGTAQLVADFKSDYEACDWITNRSAKWAREHPRLQIAGLA